MTPWAQLKGKTIYDSYRPEVRRRTRVIVDADTGLPLIINEQDYQPIVDDNARLRSQFDRHAQRQANVNGLAHVARIPLQEWNKLEKMGITADDKALDKYLDRRDARAWRVDDGRRLS